MIAVGPGPTAVAISWLYLVAIALGIAGGFVWRRVPPGRLRTAIQVVAALAFFVPQLVVVVVGGWSIALVQHQHGVLALWLAALAVALGLTAWRGTRGPARPGWRAWLARHRGVNAVLAVVFAAAAGWVAAELVHDSVQPRRVVEGQVDQVGVRRGSRRWTTRYLLVDRQRVGVTHDVYSQVRRGDWIRAEVGAGSGRALYVERRP